MHELSADAGAILTGRARAAIREALGAPKIRAAEVPPELLRDGATFVTLYREGILHGCIGSLEAHAPLAEDVAHNAVAAALRDPRATPLDLSAVDRLGVEVSVLSPLERIAVTDEASAIAALRPNVDGVLIRYGRHQGTFLPQVWASLPDPVDFLAELRRKARLPADFWHPDLEVYRYHVQKFVEKPR